MESSKPSLSQTLPVDDNDSDWSLSSVELKDINMRAEQEAELDELPSKMSVSAPNDDMSQMSRIPVPEKPQLKSSTNVFKIGRLMTFVNEFMIVESTDSMVLDLDNYVFDKEKRVLGFVADVLGPVDKPFYAIKLESTDLIPTLSMGQPIYFSEGSRLLGKDVIANLATPGTDGLGQKDFDSDSEDEVKSERGPVKRRYEQTTHEEQPRSRRHQQREHYQFESIPEIYKTYHQQQRVARSNSHSRPQYNSAQQSYPFPTHQSMHNPLQQMPVPMQPMPMFSAPPVNPEQHVYLQGLYKQYYDQMMQFYNR